MMEKVALKVKVRFVLASRELSEVLIDIVTLKAKIHKTSIFLGIDDSIQNEAKNNSIILRNFEFWRQKWWNRFLFEFSRQKHMARFEHYKIFEFSRPNYI